MATKQLTIRGVSEELGRRLEKLSEQQKQSVNATVIQLLERAVGLDARRERFRRYATWTEEDRSEFDAQLRLQRQVDDGLWK
jgi:hypothetical protein